MIRALLLFWLLLASMAWGQSPPIFGGLHGDSHWKAPVAGVGSLPSSGNHLGDVRVETTGLGASVWTGTFWEAITGGGGSGVAGVSVVTTNGFAGTSSGGSTPGLTISTTVTGIPKANGTAFSAATSGTDYSPGTSANTTGIVKSTTGTGALTTAIAADFPTLNQSTTGNALTATTATNLSGALVGDVTGTQAATVVSTVGTSSAANVHSAELAANAASTTAVSTIVKRDGSGNFTAGTITAALAGNASTATALAADPADCGANTFANAINASGTLGCTSVPNAATTAVSTNTNSTIVARDGSGNFSAGTITAALSGNATTATTATNFSGNLAGDVTGPQGTTAIAATTVTGKALTGYVSGAGTVAATDTILQAIQKLNGNQAAGTGIVPVIQVQSGNYNPLSSDDEVIWTATASGTLQDCTGLTNMHSWAFANMAAGGVVTLTAGGSNTFSDGLHSGLTTYTLSQPGTSVHMDCNKGSVIYVRN